MGENTLLTFFITAAPLRSSDTPPPPPPLQRTTPWMRCNQCPDISITAAPLRPPKQHHFNLFTAIHVIALIFSSVSQLPMIRLRNQFTLTHVGILYFLNTRCA